jgi:hypothetical protein
MAVLYQVVDVLTITVLFCQWIVSEGMTSCRSTSLDNPSSADIAKYNAHQRKEDSPVSRCMEWMPDNMCCPRSTGPKDSRPAKYRHALYASLRMRQLYRSVQLPPVSHDCTGTTSTPSANATAISRTRIEKYRWKENRDGHTQAEIMRQSNPR